MNHQASQGHGRQALKMKTFHLGQEMGPSMIRSYDPEYTPSRPIWEVKQDSAGPVLWTEMTREAPVPNLLPPVLSFLLVEWRIRPCGREIRERNAKTRPFSARQLPQTASWGPLLLGTARDRVRCHGERVPVSRSYPSQFPFRPVTAPVPTFSHMAPVPSLWPQGHRGGLVVRTIPW